MADKVNDSIDHTIYYLQETNKHNDKLVSKIGTKTITRPPFRFLHDNIMNMMQQHKYHLDLYEGDEVADAKAMDKPAKIAFLQKLIDVVAADYPQVAELDLKPPKITAGKECEKTRKFLQYLCLSVTGGAVADVVAARVAEAEGGAAEEAKDAPNEEAKEEAKEEDKPAEEPKPKAEESAPAEAKTEESAPAPASAGSADFGFTMSDVDTSGENSEKTMAMLSWVDKPKPTAKTMGRPPFRFLHDLIIAILTAKSYHPDLYEGPELTAKGMDKPAKFAFLEKIKSTLSADIGFEIEFNPAKVCAGKECEKTRTFLQYLALVAHGVKGDGPPPAAAKPKPKPKPKPEPEPEAPKPEAKESAPAPAAASAESKSDGGEGETVDDGSVEKTAAMVSAIISKPAMKPKLLARPPFRFLHDVCFNIMTQTGFGIDSFSEEEKDAKAMAKPDRTVVLGKIIDLTSKALGGVQIDVVPAKITAGKECEKTRRFLQYFCIAASGKKLAGDSSTATRAPAAKKSRPAREPEPEPEPVESKTVELPDKPRAQSRPTTARRAPPRLQNNAQNMDRQKEFIVEDVATDGVILDGEDMSDSSDDDVVEDDHSKRKKKKDKRDSKRKRGKLISKIENELDKNEKKTKSSSNKVLKDNEKKETESGIRLRSNIRSTRRPKDQINVENLQSQIQKLVQSTNPLAKCMDFVNDDLEAMDSEIEKWKSAFRRHSAQLEEEERKTAEELSPLRKEIEDVDKQVADVLIKIQECKSKITKSDSRVTEMLRFVVNQK